MAAIGRMLNATVASRIFIGCLRVSVSLNNKQLENLTIAYSVSGYFLLLLLFDARRQARVGNLRRLAMAIPTNVASRGMPSRRTKPFEPRFGCDTNTRRIR